MDKPSFLSGTAAERWNALVAEYGAEQVARKPDLAAAYCSAYARWRDAEAWLTAEGNGPVVTIFDDRGNVRSHGPAPQLIIAERSAKEMTRLFKLLGLRRPVPGRKKKAKRPAENA